MKLEYQDREILRSENLLEYDFQLPQDKTGKRLIIDLLTTKLYSDPVSAAIREIISNAFDANIEAGNPNSPIEVYLPTKDDLTLTIKDYGLGMGLDRIRDTYICLGQSNKRNSNDQIGAYGIGSLSPFAVTSQILIHTVSKGIEYEWLIYLNEDGIPTASLVKQVTNSDKPSGTSVSFKVGAGHIDYVNACVKSFSLFSNKPIKVFNFIEEHELFKCTETRLDFSNGRFISINFSERVKDPSTHHIADSNVQIIVLIGSVPYLIDYSFLADLDISLPILFTEKKNYSTYGISYTNIEEFLLSKFNSHDLNQHFLVLDVPIGTLKLTSSRVSR
jgi:Histidine kinase-, DNA gyrase B-, and HSP90-like ATPase